MKNAILTGGLALLAAAPAFAIQGSPAGQPRVAAPHTVRGEFKLYEMINYNGETWTTDTPRATVHTDWNIRSISIHPGDRWEICARPRFRECIILDRSVNDASLIGIRGQIGSARPAPAAAAPAQ